jgi:hypothetical protein
MRRRAFLSLPLAATLQASDTLDAFGLRWSVPLIHDWKVEKQDGVEVLRLATARPMESNPRRPFQYALAIGPPLSEFTLELEVRRNPAKKSGALIIVYAWQDPAHFDYVHLCGDSASEQPVHNGVFHVYGGDRSRISSAKGPGALVTGDWYSVKVTWNAASGMVAAAVNGLPNPSLQAVDLSLGPGRIGIGSFFDTAEFRNLRLNSVPQF